MSLSVCSQGTISVLLTPLWITVFLVLNCKYLAQMDSLFTRNIILICSLAIHNQKIALCLLSCKTRFFPHSSQGKQNLVLELSIEPCQLGIGSWEEQLCREPRWATDSVSSVQIPASRNFSLPGSPPLSPLLAQSWTGKGKSECCC